MSIFSFYRLSKEAEVTYIWGIRYEFPKEHVFVAVQGVDDDIHQSWNLRLELELLAIVPRLRWHRFVLSATIITLSDSKRGGKESDELFLGAALQEIV